MTRKRNRPNTSNHTHRKMRNTSEAYVKRSSGQSTCKLLADVVMKSKDAITVLDLNGRITAWNTGAEKMYGFSKAEALSMNISSIIPEDRQHELRDIIKRFNEGGEVESLETKRRTSKGQIMDVWLTFTKLLDNKGRITGLATIERNVTEHKKLLEDIEASFALAEEYTHDIDRLVAERTSSLIALNIADRIINPSVVIGMICKRLLAKDHLSDLDRSSIEMIRDESTRLQQIVNEFSTVVERKSSLFTHDDLNNIIREALMIITNEAEQKGITLDNELSETPLMINMDRSVLRTAIFYIYKNAIEATTRGGNIKTTTMENTDSVSVIISDTGCGIAEENVTHVFDHFFTTKVNAAGMGLPFVKHIIEEHFGNIEIASQKGRGTKCTMRFPVRWLKFSDGQLTWGKPLLPAVKEKEEYPLQVDSRSAAADEADRPDR